ncbi:hypothetical protein BDZ94DRAFT_1305723 [Collybia nuda]|uniref:Peptidase M12A domain-containing protein n=1 Tax=Collybia nuda TaxID=64659 RepID=A0A9P5YBD6_9AGAR|nr:hypothetical protein BDZ94DRAFT_1305723 [Collybia nuda]
MDLNSIDRFTIASVSTQLRIWDHSIVTTTETSSVSQNQNTNPSLVEIRYSFIPGDLATDTRKGRVDDVCKEWAIWANVTFIKVPLHQDIIAVQNARVKADGLNDELAKARAARTIPEKLQSDANQAVKDIEAATAKIQTLPSTLLIDFIEPGKWSYSPLGAAAENNQSMGFLAGMTMHLSLHDPPVDDHSQEATAKRNYDRGTILHEFGHILGFLHEHQSPARKTVFKFIESEFDAQFPRKPDRADVLTQDKVRQDVLAYSKLDEDSIMMYELPAGATTLNRCIPRKHDLSDLDKAYAMLLYPRPDPNPAAADWITTPSSALAMDKMGMAAGPVRTKIEQMYTYLGNQESIPNVDAGDRTRHIIQTIHKTLGNWSAGEGAVRALISFFFTSLASASSK